MSATSEYESKARQDYGPPTSSTHTFVPLLEHKLTEDMNIPNVNATLFRAIPLSPSGIDAEPDSTNLSETIILQSLHNKVEKPDNYSELTETNYHIPCNRSAEMPLETLSGIVRIEEATLENVGRLAFPIMQESEDSNDTTYAETSARAILPASMNSTLVQGVTKLPHNFTLNVDATVGNIATIQNVSQGVSAGGQTLWLPTILATSAAATNLDNKSIDEEDRSPSSLSQIIITSESYVSNSSNQIGARGANIVTETFNISRPKAAKVQILSNISIPKTSSMGQFTQHYVSPCSKETVETSLYGAPNHIYKLSTNVLPQKQTTNSVLNNKTAKTQSLITCSTLSPTVVNHSNLKSVSYTHTFSKGANINKPVNKVNNGANLNAVMAASSGNAQCHILSRVVSGPKLSVHPGRKPINTFKGAKNMSTAASTAASPQKNHASRSIKIIQQTGSVNKVDGKSWPISGVSNTQKPQTCAIIENNNLKNVVQKASPLHKAQHAVTFQKMASKTERVVLQSPCGPVLMSTAPMSTSLHRPPHYVQSGQVSSVRYVQNYIPPDPNQLSNASQVSANQHLTAQILQSLSQPKLILHTNQHVANHETTNAHTQEHYILEPKLNNERRSVFGDPSTLLTADDIIGMEERPNLSEELMRYTYQTLAFVMLDHTYAVSAQKHPPVSAITTVGPIAPSVAMSPTPVTSPQSPVKGSSPTLNNTAPSMELQTLTSPSGVASTSNVATLQIGALSYKPPLMSSQRPDDDDAGSVISSVDGRPPDRAGSDTETAPEGEEEGITRCVCDFTHDDGYMICCDRCGEWQHVDCMGIDGQNIPDSYMCELCHPRPIDRRRAQTIQLRKREELSALVASDSDSSDNAMHSIGQRRKRLLTVTTYSNTSGSCVTTYNPAIPLPVTTVPPSPVPKRGPKRSKQGDIARKGTKRKLAEKKMKRKKELMLNRNKYTPTMTTQSHWHESYELAMTNHYSPELRAKIMKYSSKLGNVPNMTSAVTAHHCTTVPHAGGKILIAMKDLKENMPIIELRGKYMLSNQHRPQVQVSGRAGSQKPGPFVFFYRLPRDNTQICIDTRTYGNEARFVRRSCKPNAELQHCIIKGALHVYLVTAGPVQSNTEITVGHDSNGGKQPCACGNPKHCKVNGLTVSSRKKSELSHREKRSRNRRSSSSSPASPPLGPIITPQIKEQPRLLTIKTEKKSPVKLELFNNLSPVKNTVIALKLDEPIIKEEPPVFKDEKPEILEKIEIPPEIEIDKKEEPEPIDIKVETVETKVEPIEEPEEEIKDTKVDIIKEEIMDEIIQPAVEEKKIPEEVSLEADEIAEFSDTEPPGKPEEPLLLPREEDKGCCNVTPRSACHERSTRSSKAAATCVNQDSLDDKTDDSQDKLPTPSSKEKKKMTREERKMEAIMKAFERMEKAEQRKQVKERQSKRRESDPVQPSTEKDIDLDEDNCSTKKRKKRKGRARTISQNTSSSRRRLNSVDSDLMTSGDEAPMPTSPLPRSMPLDYETRSETEQLNHTEGSHNDEDNDHLPDTVSEELGLSSACLLVEAAVGPLESAFKLPKTKKTMANEWLGRSPERTPSPYTSPYRPSLISAPSLESLVRVASTIIGDLSEEHLETEEGTTSPPRTPGRDRTRPPKKAKRGAGKTILPIEQAPITTAQHSAKKRWLRQAISEESDSPTAESPPNEMIAPLKKRRLARESLSCDQSSVVPCHEVTSPNFTSEDSPVKEDSRESITRHCKVKRKFIDSMYESEERDIIRSVCGHGSDDQSMECKFDSGNDFLNVSLKGPRNSEKFDMDIRRIIGVPGSEDTYDEQDQTEVRTVGKPKPMDVNDNEFRETGPQDISLPKDPDIEGDTEVNKPNDEGSDDFSIEGIRDIDNQNDTRQESAETSGNSSPQGDEMDDIQKKIHSFHTENIQILKIRNKKPPKEKRKKVNLNFDLNMVDDQISVQLRTENDPNSSKSPEMNGEILDEPSSVNTSTDEVIDANVLNTDSKIQYLPTESIPLPPVESIPLPATASIPLPEEIIPLPSHNSHPLPETIPLPEESIKLVKNIEDIKESSALLKPVKEDISFSTLRYEKPTVLDDTNLTFSSRFSSTGLFSGIFSNMNQTAIPESQINENIPNMQIIKSAIDHTTNLENSIFMEKTSITPLDELRNVQEILTRVSNMDSNNSVLLSGVLKNSDHSNKPSLPSPVTSKSYCPRTNDPRLNPPPAEKPKPIRRKLSISEYRKRHKSSTCSGTGGAPAADCCRSSVDGESTRASVDWSSDSSAAASLSPLRLDVAAAAAADELEQRLHLDLRQQHPRGVFDAQPTQVERQRENLSQRLRREFGLSLPEDEEARSATALQESVASAEAVAAVATEAGVEPSFARPGAPYKLPRFDR